jgi:muramoyltetrapeptide carboxypeptidase
MIKPNKLNIGDKVAVVAPSSPASKSQLASVEINMKQLGLNYEMLPSCYESHGHFSGTDDIRAKDINEAFSNDKYKGIICLKGGYGTPRILPLLDYELIKKNPKVFLGYSDITGLHMVLNNKCDLVTFHGPMASSSIKDDYTLNFIKRAIMIDEAIGIYNNENNEKLVSLVDGYCEGELIGGNLSLLVSTLGSPFEIDTKGKILFIEEVSESNYRIDRMLTSLMLAGKFKDCSGVILGSFSNCHPEEVKGKKQDLDLVTIFNEIISPFNKPIVMNFIAGHVYPQPTLPFGTKVILDTNELEVNFIESGVL